MFDIKPISKKAVLSWDEIRSNAANFSQTWQTAKYEKGETQSFYNDFFIAFGQRRRDVAVYEQKVMKLNNATGFIDLFWPGKLLVEQKSAGCSLEKASEQATDYFLGLEDYEKPRYILLSDFQTFELIDLETRKKNVFPLRDLAKNVELFGFIAGYNPQKYKDQDPANIDAMELMSNLHLQLEENGYIGSDLERLLVRIMFCLFADNTGIFPFQSFLRQIDNDNNNNRDIGRLLMEIFDVLDTPQEKRQTIIDEDLAQLPYVNGLLFVDQIRTPSFSAEMHKTLLKCCYFDWSKVSPALFGSLFQTVVLPELQRNGGAHYTSERNILKTINPLFLDELRDKFIRIKTDKSTRRKSELEKFLVELASLKFFDPACGCGNFLILAYRELRLLELDILCELHRDTAKTALDIKLFSKIDVDQFYGIEIEEFPVRVAEVAMWLMDHQMNMRLSAEFGQNFTRLPLKKAAHIVHNNALRIGWEGIIAPEKLSYILSNPPFVGKNFQTKAQKEDMSIVFGDIKDAKLLDYVAAWYWKAAKYIQGTNVKVAFVSTNSITQGEQVSALWQPLLSHNISIHFAHRTFKWTIDEIRSRGMKIAVVHVVIIGFAARETKEKYLFEYEDNKSDPQRFKANNINPYLVDAENIIVHKRRVSLCEAPGILYGSKPVDNGFLILNSDERKNLIKLEPICEKWIRRFIGTEEFLNGLDRYCIWLVDANPSELKKCRKVLERIEAVKTVRLSSPKISTQNAAKTPALFMEIRQPTSRYLVIPEVSSENRTYIPIGYLDKGVIASNLIYTIKNASVFDFGVLTSMMHMAWVHYICGRHNNRYRYSSYLCYNNFPWPKNNTLLQVEEIEEKAKMVLYIRTQFPRSTLADLYDPRTMPPALLKAHKALDKSVDKAYRKEGFTGERRRVEYLFTLYQQNAAPLLFSKK